jgi:hypothetical protein
MPLHGLYTDFDSYRVPKESELHDALRHGLVALDTNVLLSLYRYNPVTVDDLFNLLHTVGGRLFIPHQVVREFWRNRQSVLGGPLSSNREVTSALTKNETSTRDALTRWSKATALDAAERDRLIQSTTDLFDTLRQRIDRGVPSRLSAATPTSEDGVLQRLEAIVEGRVGAAFDDDTWAEAIAEGTRRVQEQLPPGYMDDDKLESENAEGAAGDYIVWRQLISEAKARATDLVLITADVKEDWWEKTRGIPIGPRRELVEEYAAEVGARVFFLEPSAFLGLAHVFDIDVQAESVEDVERIRDEVGAWTQDAVTAVLEQLEREGQVQAHVIREAALNGGRITRQRVYEIDGRNDEQMLRGFTRPVSRITSDLQLQGIVPAAVPALLSSHYETGVKTTHFVIPDETLPFLSEE